MKTYITENKGKLALVGATFLPVLAHAEGEEAFITGAQVTAAISGLGMGALIGAAVVAMLGISVLIWGGKRIVGFFGR